MFTFRCPGCGKEHRAEAGFEHGITTRCLRCGDTFKVTEELVHEAHVTTNAPAAGANLEEMITARPLDRGRALELIEAEEDVLSADSYAEDAFEAEVTEPGSDLSSGKRIRDRQATDEKKVRPAANRRRTGDGIQDDDEPVEQEGEQGANAPDVRKRRVPAWAILGVASIAVLVVGSLATYLMFFRGTPKSPPEKVAKSKTSANSTPPETEKEDCAELRAKPDEPIAKLAPAPERIIRLAATRLAAELASDAGQTNRKYDKTTLEVSGLFDRIAMREADQPLAQRRAVFACDGPAISCELASADLREWQVLMRNQPITVRGEYAKDGLLRACELLPLSAPAEAKYMGKEVELAGYAESVLPMDARRGFPTIVLEPETNSRVEVDCLFRKTDDTSVKRIEAGTPLIIRGTCNGRSRVEGKYRVRLDNCQIVYTSAPVAPAVRLEAAQFFRDYEEDLQRALPSAVGAEEVIETPLSVTQLAKEWASDPKVFDHKYRNKFITVSGRVKQKTPPHTLLLESEDTDRVLAVQCLFNRHDFLEIDDKLTQRVRGLFSGIQNGQTLRLDNCEPFDTAKNRDPRRLTPDYFPHTPDRTLIYDLLAFPGNGNGTPSVIRQIYFERDGGVIETVTTHVGKFGGKSLFEESEQTRWIAQKRTQKVRLAGPVYLRQLSGGFLEIGQQMPLKDGRTETVWEPVLRLLARTGDSWKWTYAAAHHQYTVVKFEEDKGRSSVTIKETIVRDQDPDHPYEVLHVYVRNLGEVARQEFQWITSREKKAIAEKKLVEDAAAPSLKDDNGEKRETPGSSIP